MAAEWDFVGFGAEGVVVEEEVVSFWLVAFEVVEGWETGEGLDGVDWGFDE